MTRYMFIVPISDSIAPVESLFDKDSQQLSNTSEDTPKFSDVFREIFTDVQETQAQTQADAIKIIQGDIDDLHTIYNNMTKASIAVETFVAVKNAAKDAYEKTLQITM